jgi:hypothetical protein
MTRHRLKPRPVVKGEMPNGRRFSFVVNEDSEHSVARARARWRDLKAEGAILEYYKPDATGRLVRVA